MGQIINGKEVALKIKEEIKTFVEERKNNKLRIPKIASILVGNDGGSIYYMSSQEKVANSLGVDFFKIILEENVTDEDVINEIHKLNDDVNVQGIMLQLPLPKHLNEKKIIKEISVKKDIDCLTFESQGKLYMGEKGFLPCTPNSVVTLIKSLNVDITGKEVVVLGRSNIVGKPVAQLLLNENATVTICHSKTKKLKEVCSKADILVVAIGKPKFIDEEYIKENAIVIDVGTSSFEGKITGDVNFDKVIDKASFLTPVPGGVGALTTTLLIKNSCEALKEYED
ncbi:bifunctional methylenetetrahydrofolate dehydrogenase/methenyltetrahydrofolate cyclohydrolase [Clostridium botulinum]|uniref:bifunctional methylenetetrahydrofolate dehydrogenase/methenyltetrahydrofolate cyclohydrolase n=1 Tax=Clostridium botulinum TaxID=1491 RepID=UPI00077424A1|nr:bifunctional methylenetetrahydrofolate dehydrogenase/methenyltetrahydrofolate cyclohydrolase [Clostridium botulinum]MBY6837362.1 bifunctional methylenetetrahydrofolate dehydrogenase/methenyltetrahydrofolate cyclohydrolase [Clostridium botulinum]NFG63922.1 bifunctional methylenetetrahydrofolate dehydrogenase/methenyltetrahydrofolate cyclohydrolase [Clostridium botulinum]NFL86492.1 bifunctional methylenetetrahydrofolate dehydrogenase/methenyltetrahydrofolate cyclohydrolase [Clostridium botulinu